MKYLSGIVLLTGLLFSSFATEIYVEDFEAAFPAWESGWLGINTNLQNYYFVKYGNNYARGRNTDGIWLDDGDGCYYSTDPVVISFENEFGLDITNLSIDITTWIVVDFFVWDNDNDIIYQFRPDITEDDPTDPGTYQSLSISSTNGISAFGFISDCNSGVEGNTSIDNVVVIKGSTPVPEPGILFLLGLSLIPFFFVIKKQKA